MISSLDRKWWYRLPDSTPTASAISRTVVALIPLRANSSAATARISSRRAGASVALAPTLRPLHGVDGLASQGVALDLGVVGVGEVVQAKDGVDAGLQAHDVL